jgi:hypothetical protein
MAEMKPGWAILLLASAVAVAACGSAPVPAHHHHAAATAPAVAASAQPAVDTAQEERICKDLKAWLPNWSPNPSARLVSDEDHAEGTLAADLGFFLGNVQQQSSAGFGAVQRDCAAVGVKLKQPGISLTAKCWHRYRRWSNGPVRFEIASIGRSLSSFSRYSNSNIFVAVTFLHIASTAAGLAQRWPVPKCADPNGYWSSYLSDEQQMGSDAGSAASAAANGYLSDAAISDQQEAQSAFNSLKSELEQTTGHRPFG